MVLPCFTTEEASALWMLSTDSDTGRNSRRSSLPSGRMPLATCWRKYSWGSRHLNSLAEEEVMAMGYWVRSARSALCMNLLS